MEKRNEKGSLRRSELSPRWISPVPDSDQGQVTVHLVLSELQQAHSEEGKFPGTARQCLVFPGRTPGSRRVVPSLAPRVPGRGISPGGRVRPREGAELPRCVARRAALAEAATTRGGRLRFLHYPDHALNAGDDDDSSGKSPALSTGESFALSGGFPTADGCFAVKLRRGGCQAGPHPGRVPMRASGRA